MSRPRVCLFLTDLRNDYLRKVEADALTAGERAGFEVDASFAQNVAVTQIQQIYSRVRAEGSARPVAVLVMPVSDDSLARVARTTVGSGVGWVSLFRRSAYVEELRRSHPQVPVFMSSPDHAAVGRIQGRQMRALLPGGGHVLFVKGLPSASSTQERFAATRQELQGSKVEIVGEIDGNWVEDVAAREVDRWLRLMGSFKGKRVDLVACQSDVMARGAVTALESVATALGRPLARIPVIGADGLPAMGQKMVDAGTLAATIVLPSPAAAALPVLERALRGTPPPPEVLLSSASYPDETMLAGRARRPDDASR